MRRVELLVLASVCVLGLVSGVRAARAPEEPNLIGGPLGRLLAGSTDLGPARSGHAQVTVALRDSTRPEALIGWARNQGLSVRWRAGDDWAVVEGAPQQVARAFGVAVHNYRSRSGQVFYASRRQPAVPAPVGAEVTALGRILSYHPVHTVNWPIIPLDVPGTGLTPTQVLTTYNASPLATTGKGQTIVLWEFVGADRRDLDQYAAKFGLPAFTLTTPVPFTAAQQREMAGAVGETEMDLEVAHAIAPDAKLVIINANTPQNLTDVANLFESVDRQFPGAIWSSSIDYGCDKLTTATDVRPIRRALATAESHGTSAFDASGDTGGFECKHVKGVKEWSAPPSADDVGLGAGPSLPEMTDVGGTTLSTDKNGVWVAEETWVDVAMSQGTGGGVSNLFDRPTWQKGQNPPAATDWPIPDVATHRLTPDVAADADPYSGMQILVNHQWASGGGTSQGAPIWAALTALMNQYLLDHGGCRLGDLNPLLYRVASGATRPAFHDVTLGGNAIYKAAPGYDLATGLGTPDTDNLVHDLLDIQQAGGCPQQGG